MIPGPRRNVNPARAATRPAVTLSACALVVRDVDEAVDFYRDVLGFDVRTGTTGGDAQPVTVGPPAQPGTRILLHPVAAPAVDELAVGGLLGRLVFTTDDCDATFEYLEAAGADVMQEPIDRPHGVRDCAFLDPSGNLLRFVQPPA